MIQPASTPTAELDRRNYRQLRRLVLSIQASPQQLNLLIAICDNKAYRDELIRTYEQELSSKGIPCYVARLQPETPSLKQTLQGLVTAHPQLEDNSEPALVTVLGADELLGSRLQAAKSAQEQFFFSVQWTRESLRIFHFPVVLWLTPAIANSLAQQAPDFWSWRGGLFEFSRPEVSVESNPERSQFSVIQEEPAVESASQDADPAEIAAQITELAAQDPDSPLLASLYHSLGDAYEAATRYPEAESAYRQALALRQKHLGPQHPDIALSLNNLAVLYEAMGRYEAAELLYQQALEIWQTELGDRNPETANSLNNLAVLYQSMGRYGEAELLYQQALEIRQTERGDRHPETATSLDNLAALYQAIGRYGEAEPLQKQALEIRQAELGDHHPSTAASLNNLAGLYHATGRYGEAEPLFQQALEITQAELGDRNPNTASSLNNLGVLYYSMERYEEAEPLLQQALRIRQTELGDRHPETAGSLFNLATLYYSTQRYTQAFDYILQALDIYVSVLGAEHPTTKNADSWREKIQQVIHWTG
jgi:tetratricopeptide (TPR) repeat protein